MAAPVESVEAGFCEIEATVVTGFENVAKEEAKEKLGVDAIVSRGRINFFIKENEATKVLQLQGIDNVCVVIKHIEDFNFTKEKEKDLSKFVNVVSTLDWDCGLRVWKQFISCSLSVSPCPREGWEDRLKQTEAKKTVAGNEDSAADSNHQTEDKNTSENNEDGPEPPPAKIARKSKDPSLPSFRATCYRNGKHSFQSPDAARTFGGAIQDYFCWNVDLSQYDIEVVLSVSSKSGYVAISLTTESLHKRHITQFGPTTLRPTIAFNMLRLCKIQPGDVVVDPMCGGGSIPIESAVNWPGSKHICGDLHEKATPRTQANIIGVNKKRAAADQAPIKVDICSWDTMRLPMKDASVDVFITDLPFGKRSGSVMRNWQLYPKTLGEMARCSKLNSGRACLLTQHKNCFTKSLGIVKKYWYTSSVVAINIGGLAACVWSLSRTGIKYDGLPSQQQQQQTKTKEKGAESD